VLDSGDTGGRSRQACTALAEGCQASEKLLHISKLQWQGPPSNELQNDNRLIITEHYLFFSAVI